MKKKLIFFLLFISTFSFSYNESDEKLSQLIEELTVVGNSNIEETLNTENNLREQIIAFAKDSLNIPYSWGATGPNKFDCSGFVKYIFSQKANIELPRISRDMATFAEKKDISNLQIGDLVFFNTSSRGTSINHVGIYIGNNEFIHASSASKKVTISTMADGFYKKKFKWAISPF